MTCKPANNRLMATTPTPSIKQCQQFARLELTDKNAVLDADILLANLLQQPRSYLYAHDDRKLTSVMAEKFYHAIKQRQQQMPMAYITGKKAFWQHEFHVSPAVLIPRPESELMVEWVLQYSEKNKRLAILELGTGSGAIALSIAHACPDAKVTAIDNSQAALAIAKENQRLLGVNNLSLQHSDWFSALAQQRFDIIISNPPYVAANDYQQSPALQFEPKNALVAADNGLACLQAIIAASHCYLKPQGYLLLEHGCQQARQVADLLQQHGYQHHCYYDLARLARMTCASLALV